MSRLFLHIGSHKTGSTSIQKACRLFLPKLSSSITYFNIRPSGTRIIQSEGTGAKFRCQIDMRAAESVFKPAARGQGKTYVSSDEEFFWLQNVEDLLPFAQMLKERFETITVLCYLRRQDLLAASHRKQVSQGSPATRFYGAQATPLPHYRPYFQKYFDYDAKLTDVWATAFGKENIQIVPYTRSELQNGDIVDDFAHRTGARFTNKEPLISNTSADGNRILAGLKLIEMGLLPKRRKTIVSQLPERGKFQPTQEEAQAFLAHFTQANERLAQRWQWNGTPFQFEPGFDMYPETHAPIWTHADMTDLLDAVLSKPHKTK